MTDAYSNREIDAHFQEIKEQLTRIENQTIRTNGRVTKLEGWRSYIIGGITILTVFGGAFLGLIIYTYNIQLGGIEKELAQHIAQTK